MVRVLLFLLLNLFVIARLQMLYRYADVTALAFSQGKAQENALSQLERRNEAEGTFSQAVLWKFEGKSAVRFEGTGREREVSLYKMKGQQGAIFGDGLDSGRYFTEGEHSVCLLDRETVRRLFGSENVLGMKVKQKETEFEIAGILEGEQPLCVVPAGEGEDFDGIAAKKARKTFSSKAAFGLLETALGGMGQQRIDGHLYYMTACLFYFVLLALLLVIGGGKGRKRKVIAVLCMFLAAEVLVLGLKLALAGSDYLPSYWSDFEFFVQLFEEKKQQIQELLHHQEFASWQQMFWGWQQTVFAEILIGGFGTVLIDGQ